MSSSPFDALGSDACRSLARLSPLLAIFVFLLPFSPIVSGLGVSVNYSFLVLLFLLRPLATWPRLVWLVVAYSIAIYLSGAIFMATDAPQFHVRQLASFLLFLGPLLVAVARMPFDFEDLARVTAVTAAAYSLWRGGYCGLASKGHTDAHRNDTGQGGAQLCSGGRSVWQDSPDHPVQFTG